MEITLAGAAANKGSRQAYGGDYQQYQGFYSHYVLPSPFDVNLLFVAGIEIRRSTNGGSSFQQISDYQAMYYGTSPPNDQASRTPTQIRSGNTSHRDALAQRGMAATRPTPAQSLPAGTTTPDSD